MWTELAQILDMARYVIRTHYRVFPLVNVYAATDLFYEAEKDLLLGHVFFLSDG